MNVIIRNPPARVVLPVVKSPKTVIMRSGTSPGGDKNFVFVQGTPSNVWVIVHNLGKYPSVSVMDSAGSAALGGVSYDNINQVTVSFNHAFSGTATLN
ncbi:MAG: hypothetical protein KGL39_58865 [Patescibacteria group bacterium]|nr:hypothetical protein [Patescibacteria group bacterium]